MHMKYCPNCGAQLPDDARFCGNCGATLPAAEAPAQQAYPQAPPAYPSAEPAYQPPAPEELSGAVQLCQDGMYRWVYEVKMLKTPAMLFTVLKVFGIAIAAIWLLVSIMSGFDDFLEMSKIFLIILAGAAVLSVLAYLIIAAINGGKYCVLFEMNETGLRHIQVPRQFKKAQVVSWITMLAGAIAGNPTVTGAGILAASRNSLATEFPKVRSIKPVPAQHLIKVNSPFSKNQVFVDEQGYDFVLNFIRSHCPKAN